MKVTKAEFVKSADKPIGYPKSDLPEIAFAGRSNVGKSTLINSLTGRKGLVKVSKTPGKTRLLNFFNINNHLMFVDLPGYGYAKVPGNIRQKWGRMMEKYLVKRGQLKLVVALLDARRRPNEDDFMLLTWLYHHEVPTLIVFTKIDKIPKTHRPRETKKAIESLGELAPDTAPLLYSSHTGIGKRELWAAIEEASSSK